MNLSPGTKIGRYEIRLLLGAGGMGEVYQAFDLRLERLVALKFLKHTDDEEKLRRFRQEAKTVSALNHPGILTIYEVEECEDRPYIVSELINGESLRDIIKGGQKSFEEILDIGVQIGNALSAAHRVGIVHRDIKPENVMILPDGYVKVLDFGLAKFVGLEDKVAPDLDGSTASLVHTKAGMIIGTVNYMSPEQLRGKTIDERTDIWSLGVVLFEMITRRRPFVGESVNDVIAAVLERPAPLVSGFEPNAPAEIESLIAKSLEKDRALRFQNATEMTAALKLAKSNLKSVDLPASFHSQKTLYGSGEPLSTVSTENLSGVFIGGTHVNWRVVIASVLGLIVLLGFLGWQFVYQPLVSQISLKQMKYERFTSTGNVSNGAISPDGRFVAYVQNADGKQSLWLRQVEENADTQLLAPTTESYSGLVFAPDGNSIYYTAFDQSGMGKLNRIRLLGGAAQEIAKDVDSAISFHADGKTFAFIRINPKEGTNQIIISNQTGERVLSETKRPSFFAVSTRESLAWSPDGKFIACPFGEIGTDGEFMSVARVSVETGERTPVTETRWYRVGRIVWSKKNDELLITAADFGSESYQIRKISLANGKTQSITGELRDYFNISLTEDSRRLLGVVYDKTSKLYVALSEQPNQTRPLAGGGGYDGIGGAAWTADNRIVYVSMTYGNPDIWTRGEAEDSLRSLTSEKETDNYPSVSADGKYIVFVSSHTGAPHVWRMNQNGGERKQLTDQGGENFPAITPDGKSVVYSRAENSPQLWKISIEGGAPQPLTKEQTHNGAISPDGKFIVCLTRAAPDAPTQIALVDFETGAIIKTFKPSGLLSLPGLPASLRWLPDSRKFAYVATAEGVSNVWTQAIEGGEPKPMTDFVSDRILAFDISRDGKKFLYARGALSNDLVLIEDF